MATPLTVLFDEDCGFCAAAAGWLAKRDGIVAAPISGAAGDEALEGLTDDKRYGSFHVVESGGRVWSAGDAVAVLLAALPAGRVTRRLAQTFPRLTDALYRRAAKHRELLGRLFRVNGCRVHPS